MMLGFGNGFFKQVFYDEDVKLPIVLISVSEFLYSIAVYVFLFMLKSDFKFGYHSGDIGVVSDSASY